MGGRTVDLTARELLLTETFLRNPGQVLSREQLLSHVWGYDVVDVYVRYLRRKISHRIETVREWGTGSPRRRRSATPSRRVAVDGHAAGGRHESHVAAGAVGGPVMARDAHRVFFSRFARSTAATVVPILVRTISAAGHQDLCARGRNFDTPPLVNGGTAGV